ncbi:MAG: hypothetical protein AAGK23_02830 [Pseudomonadota bacterium]
MVLMDIFQQFLSALLGIVVFVGSIMLIIKANVRDWDVLVAKYGRDWATPAMQKNMQTAILYSDGRPAKTYNGIITIGLFREGVGFKLNSILAPLHRPILVPYKDVQGYKKDWFLNADSMELEFRKTPGMRLIMPADQVDWIAAGAKDRVSISDQYPSHGKSPWATRAAAFLLMVMFVCAVISAISFAMRSVF